jgi:hypothetical protein
MVIPSDRAGPGRRAGPLDLGAERGRDAIADLA